MRFINKPAGYKYHPVGKIKKHMEEKNLTFGEKAVGIGFNPGGDALVDKVKKLYAEIIDILNDQKTPPMRKFAPEGPTNSENNRLFSIAITEAQGAQMWAVKAITWK